MAAERVIAGVAELRRWLLMAVLAAVLGGCGFEVTPKQAPVTDDVASRALAVALSVEGTPYLDGGQDPTVGFDCSGLIIWAYGQVIPDLKLRIGSVTVRDATQDELWRYNVVVIPPQEMKPGDIVFITNNEQRITHGGLFIEWVNEDMTEFRFVNASSYHREVTLDTWPVEGEKRGQWFVGAGRLQSVL
ncbi:MAG TPA: NlpC/P60 family protein [Limnochordales bacterium]